MSAIESPAAAVPSSPVRTCVGCRRTAAKSQLLRVVCVDGVLTADPMARACGRGAYLHRDPECLAKAEQRRAFQRALRLAEPPVVPEGLRTTMSKHSTRGSVTG